MRVTLSDGLRSQAAHQPDKIAAVEVATERTFTYKEFNERTNRLANGLMGLGLAKGDHIAHWIPNCIEMCDITFAAAKNGVVFATVNPGYVAREAEYLIDHWDAEALILDVDMIGKVQEIQAKLPKVKHFIVTGPKDKTPVDMINYDELLANSSPEEPQIPMSETDEYICFYTSGTTGLPKAPVRDQGSGISLAFVAVIDQGFLRSTNDISLLCGPGFHAGPWVFGVMAPLFLGRSVVIQKTFRPEEALANIEKYKCTDLWLVPVMLNFIANLPDDVKKKYDVSSLKVISTSGAPLHVAARQKTAETFPGVEHWDFYGISEYGAPIVICPEQAGKAPSVGRPCIGGDARIVDPFTPDPVYGRQMPRGEVGEIWVKNPAGFLYYYKNPGETKRVRKVYPNGEVWFTAEDVGYEDKEGFFYMTDRKKDMINRGGETIMPQELEGVMMEHPKVLECAVIGVPNDTFGEEPRMIVALRQGKTATEKELLDWMRGKIAKFKMPNGVDFVEALPKTGSGKILKKDLREPYWKGKEKRVH